MTTATYETGNATELSTNREKRIRTTLDQLSYLPTSVGVAVRFIELGKDPDAGPEDYGKVIQSDVSLSSKLLALANSSWFGVRNEVTKVSKAIGLLGLANVRAVSISYCMTGLHHELNLGADVTHTYWEAALCKGTAAKIYARKLDPKLEDEALLAGIFQDLGLPVMHTVAGDEMMQAFHNVDLTLDEQLEFERSLFKMNHAEVGRLTGRKLELPELYTDAIAFHHDHDSLRKFFESDVLADAVAVAALFPHVHDVWRADDRDRFHRLMEELEPQCGCSGDEFLEAVQTEFDATYAFFEGGGVPDLRIQELMQDASRELADSTTRMVSQISTMINQNASLGREVMTLTQDRDELAERAASDGLTGLPNREGFKVESEALFATLARYNAPFGVAFVDLDAFKIVNDTHGHNFGDFCLQELARRVKTQLPKDALFARLGGDEFVIVLPKLTAEQAQLLLDHIVDSVGEAPFVKGKCRQTVTISGGLAWVAHADSAGSISEMMSAADGLMYQAKQNGKAHAVFQDLSRNG